MNIIIHIKNDEIYIFYNILHLYIYIYTFMYGINYQNKIRKMNKFNL